MDQKLNMPPFSASAHQVIRMAVGTPDKTNICDDNMFASARLVGVCPCFVSPGGPQSRKKSNSTFAGEECEGSMKELLPFTAAARMLPAAVH